MSGAELRREHVGFRLCLGQSDARLEATHDSDGIAPVANFVHVGGDEEIDAKAGRKNGSEIEGLGKHADDGNGAIIEIDGVAEH